MKVLPMKRKKRKAGFTLAETLIAILILLMVSAVVAGALPTASNVFAKTVDSANAQMLLSTTMTVLRDELGTATNVKIVNDTTIDYNNGSRTIAYLGESSGVTPGIWLTYKNDEISDDDSEKALPRLIVSEKAATKDMIVSFEKVAKKDNGTIEFSELKVTKEGYNNASGPIALAYQETFVVRLVTEPVADGSSGST